MLHQEKALSSDYTQFCENFSFTFCNFNFYSLNTGMPTCCVPFCDSGYSTAQKRNKKKGIPNPHFFSMPHDPDLFSIWERKISRKDRKLSSSDKVCSLHFLPEFIDKFYPEITMKDGSVTKLERGRVRLKPNAVPLVFEAYPDHMQISKGVRIRKPKRRCPESSIVPPKRRKQIAPDELDLTLVASESSTRLNTPVTSNDSVFMELSNIMKDSLHELKWKIITEDDALILMQFGPNYEIIRKIIISKTLSLKEARDVLPILEEVNSMKVCRGAMPQPPTCRGYLSKRSKNCVECVRMARRCSTK